MYCTFTGLEILLTEILKYIFGDSFDHILLSCISIMHCIGRCLFLQCFSVMQDEFHLSLPVINILLISFY